MPDPAVEEIASALVRGSQEVASTGAQSTWGRLVQLVERKLCDDPDVAGVLDGSNADLRESAGVEVVRDALVAATLADPVFGRQLVTLWVLMQRDFNGPDSTAMLDRSANGFPVQAGEQREQSQTALPVPRQLPMDVANFTGRTVEIARLGELLLRHDQHQPPTAVISAIAGAPGIGKTALALRWAHHVSGAFVDGQLYVNLRGYGPGAPLEPSEVLTDFLRALDIAPAKIPREVDAKAALYRSLLDGRRMIVVLDNAMSTDQVRPLLPGTATCMVIVTSRSRLAGLVSEHGAVRIRLGVLLLEDSVTLLRQVIDDARVDQEPAALRELAIQCGSLPLALRIAGERVAAYPHTTLSELVDELADEHRRLDALSPSDGDTSEIRATFSWSYRALGPRSARTFRLLGLHASGELSVEAAAAITGVTVPDAHRRLHTLVDSNLLEQTTRDRYRFHDLLRSYAAELAVAEESPETRVQAVRECLLWYLHTADAANRALMPQRRRISIDPAPEHRQPLVFADRGAALAWCDTERNHLIAATRQAWDYGLDTIAWQLPVVLWSFFSLRKLLDDWIVTHEIGIEAARRGKHRQGEGWALNSLGNAYRELHRHAEAASIWQQALAIRREIGDPYGEGTSLNNLAGAYRGLGRYDEALEYSRQALQIHRTIGDKWNEGINLNSLGNALRELHRNAEAILCWEQALAIQQIIGDRYGEGTSLNHLGETYHLLARWTEAIEFLQRALVIRRQIGDQHGEAVTAANLGRTLHGLGLVDSARALYVGALRIFEEMGDPRAAPTRAALLALPALDERPS